MARALCDVTSATVLPADRAVYEEILRDVFGAAAALPSAAVADEDALRGALARACVDAALEASEPFLAKCVDLDAALAAKRYCFLVGGATVGKSAMLRTLLAARRGLDPSLSTRDAPAPGVRACVPGALAPGRLFGAQGDREWLDGVVSAALRVVAAAAVDSPREPAWLLLDGAADDQWLEDLSTVLSGARRA